MRTDIRSEIIKLFHDLLNTHVHGDAEAFSDLVDDLLESKKWTSLFGISRHEDKNITSRFLSSLVNEYQFHELSLTATLLFKVLHLKLSKHKLMRDFSAYGVGLILFFWISHLFSN